MRREAPSHARTPRGSAGFTLIEVMIALLLVIALATVVWASLAPMRDRVAMDEACSMVAAGIDQSRSLAASSNQVLEVRASIEAKALEIQARAVGVGVGEVEDDAARGDEERPWTVLVRIVGSFAREDPMADPASEPMETPVTKDGEPEFVSIGMVLPDGSMVAGVPLRLKDTEGRWTVVRVGTWMTRLEVEAAPETSGEKTDSEATDSEAADEASASSDAEKADTSGAMDE